MKKEILKYFKNEFDAESKFEFSETRETETISFATKDFNGCVEVLMTCEFGTEIGGEDDEILKTAENISFEVVELQVYDNKDKEIKLSEDFNLEVEFAINK